MTTTPISAVGQEESLSLIPRFDLIRTFGYGESFKQLIKRYLEVRLVFPMGKNNFPMLVVRGMTLEEAPAPLGSRAYAKRARRGRLAGNYSRLRFHIN